MAHFVYPTANPMAQCAPPAQAYPSAQNAYVAAAPQAAYAATAAAPRAGQAYEGYPAAASATVHPPTQYAYSRTQVAVTPTVTYDQTKAYYQPSAASTYSAAADPQFQAAKPAFSTNATFAAQQRQTLAPPKAQQGLPVSSTGTSYVYSSTTPAVTTPAVTAYSTGGYTATTTPQSSISSYDAALYSAATSYYSQQHLGKTSSSGNASWMMKKTPAGNQFKPKPKGPPKAPQLHYCDVCKISCAGPQTYREHLEGQKHKKKEAALKASQPSGRQPHNQMRCELCDVTCTGQDAYAAHIRGAKHQKVVKLHTKLGKPIPSAEPVVQPPASTQSAAKAASSKGVVVQSATAAKKVLAAPKINFVGGTQLKTLSGKAEEVKTPAAAPSRPPPPAPETQASMSDDEADDSGNSAAEKDVAPVGHEYIEEIRNEIGKTVSFNCKLCDCKFNDPNAKEMHLKGRRHRLQYKKKVDPNLQVEVKPSIRVRKAQEDKHRRQQQKDEFWRRKEQQERLREEMRMEDEIYWGHRRMEMMGGPPDFHEWQRFGPMGPMGPMMRPPFPMHPMAMRRPDTSDDRHVMAKHHSIYPTEDELQAVQNIVSACEKSLKLVSDTLADHEFKDKPAEKTATKKAVKTEETVAKKAEEADKEDDDKNDDGIANRVLKGVMRVGVLAKGLLLHGDLNVNIVVLCSEKPTRTLLEQVADALPKQLSNMTNEELEVRRCVEEAAIIVRSEKEPAVSCTITLTSPIMRETNLTEGESLNVKDPPDVLDRQKCLDALAALRHAKWFQARANGLPSCVVIIRILRDLCQRVPAWTPLNEWAMELLVEKCVSTGGATMGPGDSLRRVFECIASGIILPGGPGLYDPCEKEAYDVTATLSNQQREDITALAQHALRSIAFRQIHKVLGMDALPPTRFASRRFNNRKRRHTNSTEEDGGEKKDRKEKEETAAAQ